MKKRIVSILLIAVMVLSMVPATVFAATEEPIETGTVFSLPELWSAAGSTFEVDVTVTGNPGILGAVITLSWDESLTLVDAVSGEAFEDLMYQGPGRFNNSGTNFVWYGNELSNVTDGTVLTLTFQVSEATKEYDHYGIYVSAKSSDIYDQDYNPIEIATVDGGMMVINFIPGDANDNGRVTVQDLIFLSQYISDGCVTDPEGYNITLNDRAVDVDDSGTINPRDLILTSQYISDGCVTDPQGYNVTLRPSVPKCGHEAMEEIAAKAATCTETGNIAYWYCPDCEKHFSDAAATAEIALEDTIKEIIEHNSILFDSVPATPTTEGYTAGVWCDMCETWLSGHEVIPPIEEDQSNIRYRHYVKVETSTSIEIVSDDYLNTHEIVNPNPVTYVEGKGVTELIEGVPIDDKKVSANGYSFLGWFEKPEVDAKRVYSISEDAKGDKILYGIWSKDVYTITYLPDSPTSILPKVPDGTYTVDKDTSLEAPPSWPNLFWIGWSNEDGKVVKSIPKGTTGNITLTANWMSRRNQTFPNTKYAQSAPMISADEENGIYTFTYEIGEIQNVPIQTGEAFNLVQGQIREIEETFTKTVGEGESDTIANVIANATTRSDSWTLSEDWNKTTTFSEEHSSEVTEEEWDKATDSHAESQTFTISSGKGGSATHTDETGMSTKVTEKDEYGVGLNIGKESTASANFGIGGTYKGVDLSAGFGGSNTFKTALDLDYKHTTEVEQEFSEKHTDSVSSHWDINESYEISEDMSHTDEHMDAITTSIKNSKQYGESLSYGGSKSNTVSSSETSSESREYASTITYSTETGTSTTIKETLTGEAETGHYRKVMAANFKVFAVVIYDMKTNTYSAMTHSLMINGSEHIFTDYSTVSSFDDYENGVLPFDVPSYVNEYVYGLLGKTEGLRIDPETGIVTRYGYKDPATGICYKMYDEITNTYSEPCDTDVIIPHFDVQNGKIVPVTGIAPNIFQGTNITSVYLNADITEIPEGAFADCSSLRYIRGGAVESIGKDAFKNCTSLFEMTLPHTVTSLGVNAFQNVEALTVSVANASVFDAALASGVKKLSLDLSNLEGNIENRKIETPATMEYLFIDGGGQTLKNVSIKPAEDAVLDTLILTDITIENYSEIPLQLNSANVELGFTTISASGMGMKLDAEQTNLVLDGNNYLNTAGENAMLTKGVYFKQKENSSSVGQLHATGNVLVYGTAYGTSQVKFDSEDHTIKYLNAEEYDSILNSKVVYFDANGGAVDVTSKVCDFGAAIGTLPVPEKIGFAFEGWFMADGTLVTETTQVTDEMTVIAQWKVISCTYNIIYKSTNGTALGSSTVTCDFGTTNTVSAPAKAGYNTPAAQNVAWDSVEAKTITFIYTPSYVGATKKSGQVYNISGSIMSYGAVIEYRNRTATSVQLRVTWTNSLNYGYINNGMRFWANVGAVSTNPIQVVAQGDWGSQSSSARSSTVSSGWITVSLNTTSATSVNMEVKNYQCNYYGTDLSSGGYANLHTTWTIAIPAF